MAGIKANYTPSTLERMLALYAKKINYIKSTVYGERGIREKKG